MISSNKKGGGKERGGYGIEYICYCPYEANFDLWDQINISSCMWLLPKEGLLICSKNSLNVKVLHAHICSPFLMEIWVWDTISCLSNKSSYLSWTSLYTELSSFSTSFSSQIFIFGWWCHYAISATKLCEQVQREKFYRLWWGQIWPMGPNQHIILYVTPP